MDRIEVVPFSPELAAEWDAFVESANNGTLFHQRAFLAYHPPDRFLDDSVLFFKKGKLVAVLPAARRHGDAEKLWISHPGASFGGPVVRHDLSLRDAQRIVRRLVQYARDRHYGGIDLTLPPVVYLDRPSQYIDFALYREGFRYRKREVSSVIPLPSDPEAVWSLFLPQARRNVRRAQKLGVKVRRDDRYEEFYTILERNLKLRHNVIPTHTLSELQDLVRRFPERIHLFVAEAEGQMVAGIVLFDANDRTTLAFYISHREEFQHLRSVNLLFYEVFVSYIERGYRFLDFGLFTVNMEPNWGLARFKESFGAQGVFRDSWRRMFT